ncbi:MAG: hypothetical protein ACI9TH_004717 [Kiritimatiellia bacterium]|jgi:hypothetical protein
MPFGNSTCFGLDAEDGSTPIVHDDHVFTSSAYGTGGGRARITDDRKAEEVYFG